MMILDHIWAQMSLLKYAVFFVMITNIMTYKMNKSLPGLVNDLHVLSRKQGATMFRITTEKKRGKVILTVEGRLAGQGVSTFEQCWRELRGDSPQEKFSVNLCGVTFIDAPGFCERQRERWGALPREARVRALDHGLMRLALAVRPTAAPVRPC